jgi:hypothetical protein
MAERLPPGERYWNPDHELADVVEVVPVQSRVGLTPRARLQWAFNFALRDLTKLTRFDWENLRREIVAFDTFVIPYDQVDSEHIERWLEESARSSEAWPIQPVPLPSREKIQRAREEFHDYISTLIETAEVAIALPASTAHILRTPVHGRTFFHLADRGSLGRMTLTHLLGAFGPLIRECAEMKCRRWFIARRLNQHYCATRCQSRATSRTHRRGQAKKTRGRRKT